MADNHEQFIEFNETIKLDESKKNKLRTNRDVLRKKIKKYFTEEKSNEVKPVFSGQGSFMMHVITNPIPKTEKDEDGNTKTLFEYDLDDGVYFIDDLENRKSPSTYHNWIYNSVKDHTSRGALKKNTCVRVLYVDGHHIDLPIYFKEDKEGSIPQLAHKAKGYVDSDPREFWRWFNDCADEQLKRIVRYLKAWREKQNNSSSTKLPSGMVLSILAENNFVSNDRDDIAFRDTLEAVKDSIDEEYVCYRPTVDTTEDLLEKYSEKHFKDRLAKLIDSGNAAINHSNPKEACKKWQKHFGDRFCCANLEDKSNSSAKSYEREGPAVLKVNAGSA